MTTALYNETTNSEKFVEETMNIKKEKNSKQSHAFKGYVYTYNVEILNSFSPELQLKNTESGIENKLKIVYYLVLKNLKILMMKGSIVLFIQAQRLK